jgi:hypothetical protein
MSLPGEAATSAPLPLESRQALRLAAMFWLAAALPHAIGTSVFAVAAMRSAAMSRSDLFGFARNLAEPNIFPAVWRVMLWWNASGTIERMLIAIVAATPLA